MRSATYESMATERGEITDELVTLYETLAKGEIGLIITGHAYVHPRGQAGYRQIGIHEDSLVPGLRRVVEAVHRQGGRIFAQLAHAGSQSQPKLGLSILAPSPIRNPLTGQLPKEATESEIQEVIRSFRLAASRAVRAGFDGVHIRAKRLLNQRILFSLLKSAQLGSLGRGPEGRDQFLQAISAAVREAVGPDFPGNGKARDCRRC